MDMRDSTLTENWNSSHAFLQIHKKYLKPVFFSFTCLRQWHICTYDQKQKRIVFSDAPSTDSIVSSLYFVTEHGCASSRYSTHIISIQKYMKLNYDLLPKTS